MKTTLIFLICLAPFCTIGQVVDTTAVTAEVDSLFHITEALYNKGDFKQMLAQATLASDKIEKSFGRGYVQMGICLNMQGLAQEKLGNLNAAESLNKEAKNIIEKELGRESDDYINIIANIASLYTNMGRYTEAEPICIEAKKLSEKIWGSDDPKNAVSLNNLAVLYKQTGRFTEAELLFQDAKNLLEKTLGKSSPNYSTSLNNLAVLYKSMGRYTDAEQLFKETIDIDKMTLGPENPLYGIHLNNLGDLYRNMERYTEAEPIFIEVKNIFEKNFGKEHMRYAIGLVNLGLVYRQTGRFTEAEPLLIEAKNILNKTLGPEHPLYAMALTNLAALYQDMGRMAEAEPMHLEAQRIREKVLGKAHPEYLLGLNNLGALYGSMGRYEDVGQIMMSLKTGQQKRLTNAAHFLSEYELGQYTATFTQNYIEALNILQKSGGHVSTLNQVCFDNAIFFKGFLLQTATQIKFRLLSNTATADRYEKLAGFRRRLEQEYTKPIAGQNNDLIADLESRSNALEKELTQMVGTYQDAYKIINWQDVQAKLRPGEAALEFVYVLLYDRKNKPTDSTLYAALVLKPGDTQPHFIPLFEKNELTPLLQTVSSGNNIRNIDNLYAQKKAGAKQKSLYDLIWQPLETALQGSNTVYCAPTGLLNRINLAAIPNNSGQFFGDQHHLIIMGSTRQLVVPNAGITNTSDTAYLAGGIRYETDSAAIAFANRGVSSRSINTDVLLPFQPDSISISRGGILDYLPATATEVDDISQTLASVGIRTQVDTGFYATEESFRKLGAGKPAPRIIHLATHGYFFPDPVKGKGGGATADGATFKMSEHPMIRSGLIMAGAKQAWLTGKHPEGQEDGILTAYEISQMNLAGTDLAVLSACETGLGDIVGNEGVFGLQRAFKIAGVKYLIMSLWKVDDKSTQDFMTTFYKHWLTDKLTVPEAFRTTQREMRAKRPGAYDWAGFVLIE